MKVIRIHPRDNVAVALEDVAGGEVLSLDGLELTAAENVRRGHKIALAPISAGESIMKYGCAIGTAKEDIPQGAWVHVHNVRTGLSESGEYRYDHKTYDLPSVKPRTFRGYRRADGRAAIRNELWIVPTVGCVNSIAQRLVRENRHLVRGTVEGLYTFPHPFGCSQMGDDHAQTRRLLAALARHPNAGGVLVLGLGCENLTMEQFKAELGPYDENRVKFLVCQDVPDEIAAGGALLKELADYAGGFQRQDIPAAELVVGMKCGGSDGLSGITANPTVGAFSDLLISKGGTTILTEVPEMFGAETLLMNRCENEALFEDTVGLINGFKNYFTSHNQTIYENPSPGNKKGGISTLEDKSLGCTQKSGSAPVSGVLSYGEPVKTRGLNLLSAPGNDLVASTALAASGAHIVLFTTGRGTPFASPVPTVKISSNSALAEKKRNWIDFDCGGLVEDGTVSDLGRKLFDYVVEVASGREVKAEEAGFHDMAIFKQGVTL